MLDVTTFAPPLLASPADGGLSPIEQAASRDFGDQPALIRVADVSKQFVRRSGNVGDLRERFVEWRHEWERRRQGLQSKAPSSFYALQNVSFEVRRGQSVGIVGHNGSGKSTLLKMLTGILKPTTGTLTITGRVGALIEVGAGFHPDLTGRENVFLNGSILGLSRREIERRMDDIVRFAGLEQFIDTPVKRYSSGMYMRLGFSVAAHTDPDILLIDEVLAVGDLLFQRKCLRHLKEFTARGGTLVFVSHAMDQVRQVCDTCVWLDHGQVRFVGGTDEAIEQYFGMVAEREDDEFRRNHPDEWAERQAEQEVARIEALEAEERARQEADLVYQAEEAARREEAARKEAAHQARVRDTALSCITSARIGGASGDAVIPVGQIVPVEIGYRLPASRGDVVVGVEIFRADGLYIWGVSNYQYNIACPAPGGTGLVRFTLGPLYLTDGEYRLRVSLFPEPNVAGWDSAPEDVVESAARFRVTSGVQIAGCVALPVSGWHIASADAGSDLQPHDER